MSLSVDLDKIAAGQAGSVTFNGTTHQVRAITASLIQLLQGAKPETYVDVSLTIAKRCVPTLSDADVDELTPKQLEAILAVATNDTEEVAKLAPDYVAPDTSGAADPNGSGPAESQNPSPA